MYINKSREYMREIILKEDEDILRKLKGVTKYVDN